MGDAAREQLMAGAVARDVRHLGAGEAADGKRDLAEGVATVRCSAPSKSGRA
ncbi:MAG: hypothetical protein PGN13_00775 [Patulibacter minatonensis]